MASDRQIEGKREVWQFKKISCFEKPKIKEDFNI